MLEAILFDMGGTLDGDGWHWLDRFFLLYDQALLSERFSRSEQKEAFYAADRRANTDPEMPELGFRSMVERYVDWQLAHLNLEDDAARRILLSGFADRGEELLEKHRQVVRSLRQAGLKLGIISNFCGNISTICDEFGYSPFLSVVLDSRHVGINKPDPAIFELAARQLQIPAERIAYVGDSFDRDVEPARQVGMKTFWLKGDIDRNCPDPTVPDGILTSLSELPARWQAVC